MPRTALTLYAILLALAVGLRAAAHKWQTGSFGLRLSSSKVSESAVGALLALAALLVGVAAPLLQLVGMVTPWPLFGGAGSPGVPVVIFALGLAGVLVSQFAMSRRCPTRKFRCIVARGRRSGRAHAPDHGGAVHPGSQPDL